MTWQNFIACFWLGSWDELVSSKQSSYFLLLETSWEMCLELGCDWIPYLLFMRIWLTFFKKINKQLYLLVATCWAGEKRENPLTGKWESKCREGGREGGKAGKRKLYLGAWERMGDVSGSGRNSSYQLLALAISISVSLMLGWERTVLSLKG